MRVSIDFSHFDNLSRGGQYRYGIDLVRALSLQNQTDIRFLLLGSQKNPPEELRKVLKTGWDYHRLSPSSGKGSLYRDQWRYSREASQASLFHGLHMQLPILTRRPVVSTVHDLMFELFDEYHEAEDSRAYRLFRWTVRKKAARIIAISESTARDLEKLWHVSPERVLTISHGSDFGENWPDAQLTLPARLEPLFEGPTLLSPYNLEPRKNLAALVEAMPQIRRDFPKAKLLLFGAAAINPEREILFEKTLAEKGLGPEQVVRIGVLTDQELAACYLRCTLFVFPSLYEGFGLPVLEAMRMGACVVARRASAMAGIVGSEGILVEPCNAGGLASAITGALADQALRERLAKGARQRAREKFTLEGMGRKTLEAYRSCLCV